MRFTEGQDWTPPDRAFTEQEDLVRPPNRKLRYVKRTLKAFPVLEAPSAPLDVTYEDNTIRSNLENGMEVTRAKFTRRRRSWASVKWTSMSAADFAKLDNFYRNITGGGGDMFTWTLPTTRESVTVRFSGAPVVSYGSILSTVAVTIALREV